MNVSAEKGRLFGTAAQVLPSPDNERWRKYSYNKLCCTGLGHSKCWRVLKLYCYGSFDRLAKWAVWTRHNCLDKLAYSAKCWSLKGEGLWSLGLHCLVSTWIVALVKYPHTIKHQLSLVHLVLSGQHYWGVSIVWLMHQPSECLILSV